MNLEELQAMSDAELNELSAVKVMGWKLKQMHGYKENAFMINEAEFDVKFISAWNPTTDMKDAMELYKALGNREKNSFVKNMLSFFENVSKHGLETWDIVEMLILPLKYWVIASILAKE